MDGVIVMEESAQNMKTAPPQIIQSAASLIGIDEARHLLDLAIENEDLHTEGELSDHALHHTLNKLTGLAILLPMTKP